MPRVMLLLPDSLFWALSRWSADEHRQLREQMLHVLASAVREHQEQDDQGEPPKREVA